MDLGSSFTSESPSTKLNMSKTLQESATEQDLLYLRNQQESPLLRLPAELRNRIYSYALGSIKIGVCHQIRENKPIFRSLNKDGIAQGKLHASHVLALPKTCRQIHSEAALLLFSLKIVCSGSNIGLINFAHSLYREQRNAITAFKLVIGERWVMNGPLYWHCPGRKWIVQDMENFLYAFLATFPGVRHLIIHDLTARNDLFNHKEGLEDLGCCVDMKIEIRGPLELFCV